MSNIEAQISPRGYTKRSLVDCLYAVVSSIKGICAKLDDDGGVTLETYEANVVTAILNGALENSRGDRVANALSGKEATFFSVSPTGIDTKALVNCIYQFFDMMETLTEQLDTDTLTDSNYESLVYTVHYLWTVKNEFGSSVGVDTGKTLSPMGVNMSWMPDLCYCFVHSLHTLCDKLDDDGTVTDTDYEALWDTANILLQVEDTKGNIAGNALTKFNP